MRDLARQHTDKAIEVLAGIMNDASAPPTARQSAAAALLDRGWGRPETTANVSDNAGSTWIEAMKRLNEEREARRKAEQAKGSPENRPSTGSQ